MKRTLSKVVIQDDRVRYRVVIEGEPCLKGSQEARFEAFNLLRMMGEDPTLTACGLNDFQELIMRHTGDKWVIQAEAIEEKRL